MSNCNFCECEKMQSEICCAVCEGINECESPCDFYSFEACEYRATLED